MRADAGTSAGSDGGDAGPFELDAARPGADLEGQASGLDCEGWTSATDRTQGTRGYYDVNDGQWTQASPRACSVRDRIYCFELTRGDDQRPDVAPPANGRIVLRSSSVKRSWRPRK